MRPRRKDLNATGHAYDRIAWATARAMLVQITRDSFYAHLHPSLRKSIETFLTRYPRKFADGRYDVPEQNPASREEA